MKTNRLIVFMGFVGAVLGMSLDGYFSYKNAWGYSPVQNIVSTIFGGLIFWGAARMALNPQKSVGRVEQVVGRKLRAEDCYESIVIKQKEF